MLRKTYNQLEYFTDFKLKWIRSNRVLRTPTVKSDDLNECAFENFSRVKITFQKSPGHLEQFFDGSDKREDETKS